MKVAAYHFQDKAERTTHAYEAIQKIGQGSEIVPAELYKIEERAGQMAFGQPELPGVFSPQICKDTRWRLESLQNQGLTN
jgi:hypothetical protein